MGVAFGVFLLVVGIAARIGFDVWRSKAAHKAWVRKGREKSGGAASYAALIRSQVRALAQPTLWLTPTQAPGFSKLGGDPELPRGLAWPEDDDLPRAFVGQIDLAEVRAAGGSSWLPAEGRLYAFHDGERVGCADLVRLIYTREPAAAPVAPLSGPKAPLKFPERRVGFFAATSLPSSDWLDIDPRELADDDDPAAWDALAALETRPQGKQVREHRIGGYPSEIQGGRLQLECEHLARDLPDPDYRQPVPADIAAGAATWRLLLQIDSDNELQMNWVDGGMLYVFVRQADAEAGDFSKAVTVCQFN
jgi:hypothetical protein